MVTAVFLLVLERSDMENGVKKRVFGDEHFFYNEVDGSPKYENIDEQWDIFIQWIRDVREKKKTVEGFSDSSADRVGREVIKWAEKHDAYAIYMLTKFLWVDFRDTYLLESGCPEIVLEFIRGIMYKKMTEKQMWGTDEDRRPTGKIIVFDKSLLPQGEPEEGKLPVEYCPIKKKE